MKTALATMNLVNPECRRQSAALPPKKRTRRSSPGNVFACTPLILGGASGRRHKSAAKTDQGADRNTIAMPSLVRFLSVIAIIAAVIYAGVYALSHFVQPKPREITVSIPPEKFFKNRQGP